MSKLIFSATKIELGSCTSSLESQMRSEIFEWRQLVNIYLSSTEKQT